MGGLSVVIGLLRAPSVLIIYVFKVLLLQCIMHKSVGQSQSARCCGWWCQGQVRPRARFSKSGTCTLSKCTTRGTAKCTTKCKRRSTLPREGEADIGPALQPTFAHPSLTLPCSVAHWTSALQHWLSCTLSYPVPPKQAHTVAWSKELLRTFVPHSLVRAQKLVVLKKGSVVQHICAEGTVVQREAQKHLEPQHWIIFNANLST